ncbi:MAG: hypothetical protein U0271_04925 [Polyangiaceae bacterium]
MSPEEQVEKKAKDAFTDGIAALLIGWLCFLWIILGIRAIVRASDAERMARSMGLPDHLVSNARTGRILGIVALAVWGLGSVIGLVARMP